MQRLGNKVSHLDSNGVSVHGWESLECILLLSFCNTTTMNDAGFSHFRCIHSDIVSILECPFSENYLGESVVAASSVLTVVPETLKIVREPPAVHQEPISKEWWGLFGRRHQRTHH